MTPQTAVQNNTPLPSDIINGNPHRFGGYLASGGTPRGVDTIPIWASKGEFVSTRIAHGNSAASSPQ